MIEVYSVGKNLLRCVERCFSIGIQLDKAGGATMEEIREWLQ